MLRVALLGLVAVAAAATSAMARSHDAAPRGAAAPPNCTTTVRSVDPDFDAAFVHRIAPTTTVHLQNPLRVTPPLGQGGYVFPLLGPYPTFDSTFAAPRDVGWHHGDDLFAPRGAPVLAVADGVVFSVGWNRIGGWRLWLADRSGNLFYYAHLEKYSLLAVDGRRVKAGQVLGYVGTSGDARTTPPHLFFEINPASLTGLGYDGTVDPTSYLRSWTELRTPVAVEPAAAMRVLAATRCAQASAR